MPVNSFGDPIEAPHGGAGAQVLNSFGDPVELPGPPKAPIPQGLAEPFSQQYGLTAAQRADVRSRDTRGLEEIGGATLIPAASGAVRAAAAGEPILPAVVQSAKNLGTSMVSGTVAALGARKAAKYLGAPEGVADAAAIIGGLYGAKAGGSVSEYLSAEKGIPSTWKFLKWLRNRPATTVPEAEEPETAAPSPKPAAAPRPATAQPAEAPAPAAGKPAGTAADMMNAEYGPNAPAAPAPAPKSPGQVLYESDARPTDVPWEHVPKDQQAMFEQFAAGQARQAAGAPPPSPTPSSGPAAQPASAAASTVLQPNGGPLRPPLAPQPAAAAPSVVSAPPAETPPNVAQMPKAVAAVPPETQDIDFQMRYGEQEQPEVAKFLGHDQPAPASKAPSASSIAHLRNAQAKGERFADALMKYRENSTEDWVQSNDFLENWASDPVKSKLTQKLIKAGLLKNTEKFSDTSWPYMIQKLRQAESAPGATTPRAATPASEAPSTVPSAAPAELASTDKSAPYFRKAEKLEADADHGEAIGGSPNVIQDLRQRAKAFRDRGNELRGQ